MDRKINPQMVEIMKVIDRYLVKQFLSHLSFSLLVFWVIFLVVDIVEHVDLFIDRQAGLFLVIKYYLFYTPYILSLVLPVGMLLSSLFSLGTLAKNNELLAFKSAGISLYRIILPLLILSFILSLVSLSFNELVVPFTNLRKDEIRTEEIDKKKKERGLLFHNVFVQGENNRIFYLGLFDGQRNAGTQVLVQRFEGNKLIEQIEAKKMSWTGNGWLFENGRYRVFADSAKEGEEEKFSSFEKLFRLDLKVKPFAFTKKQKKPEEMGFGELKNYVEIKKKTGQKTAKELTDLYMKLSFPLINFIIVLFGSPLAANPKRSGKAFGFALSLFISFVYYILIRMGQSFGYSEKLSPILATWSANIIFAALGILLLIKAKK
jgi:lipopolysaccharide export system permease protein